MAEPSPFLPPGGLADLARVDSAVGVVDEPPADHVCDPPAVVEP